MKKASTLLLILLLGMTACKKEVTETKVEQVNQAFSAVYNINPEDWSGNTDGTIYSAFLDVPELNNPIYDHGAVLVYLSFNQTDYEALPEVFDGFTYGVLHNEGHVTVDISALDGAPIDPPTQQITAKIVLIDAQALELHPDVNLHDYHSVQQAFKVK